MRINYGENFLGLGISAVIIGTEGEIGNYFGWSMTFFYVVTFGGD